MHNPSGLTEQGLTEQGLTERARDHAGVDASE